MNVPDRATEPTTQLVEIDKGMRDWYESCPCCMSKANPEVKQALDAEKAGRRGGKPTDGEVTEAVSLSDRFQAAHDQVIDEPLPEWLEEASCGPHVKHLAHLAMNAAETGANVEQWEAWVRGNVVEASPALIAEAEDCMRSAGLWPWHERTR